MTIRCGCSREGDATVFGLVHECSKDPDLRYGQQQTLPKLIPSWRFVVPETSEGIRVIACTPPPVEGVAADNLQQELNRVEGTYDPDLQEARIHQVLGPDELED